MGPASGCSKELERETKRIRTDAGGDTQPCVLGEGASEAAGEVKQDDYESAEAWGAWEEEMKLYTGWEGGGGEGVACTSSAMSPSGVARDELASQLLEDMQVRISIVSIMAEAGVPPDLMHSIHASHVRSFTLDGGEIGRAHV